MGIAIPQVIAEDRASSAQVIDGSIVFDRSKLKHLKRTISTTGNQKTFTVSTWFKQCRFQDQQYLFTSEYLGSGNEYFELTLSAGYQLQLYNSTSAVVNIKPSALLRDTAWYHIVVAVDTAVSPAEDRVKFYINGERQTDFDAGHSAFPSENYAFELSNSRHWFIGAAEFSGSMQGHYDGPMSNFYFVDGQALGPEEFGFTDPLTNTWRPKKYDTTAPTNNPNNNTTWSNNVTASSGGFGAGEEVTKGFDGNLTTKCKTNTNGADINITFSGISVEKLLRIRTNYTNGQNSTITVNGTNYGAAATASDGEYKVISGFTGPLTSIVLSADSAVNAAFSAIEVDGVILQDATTTNNRTWDGSITFGTNGFYLPMDGNSPIGEDKSGNSNINDGTIWSNDVTTSNAYSANRDPGKGFDGNSSLVGQSDTYVQSDNSSGTVTWTPNGYTIDTADEILVKGISSLDRLSVVGSLGSQSNIAPATVNGITNVYTIPTNLGTLTSLTVTGNSSLAGWSGISVGGILLVNGLKGNSWTPVNFSGSSAIDKATGALPILNTVSGGKVATVGVRTDATVAAGVGTCVLALPFATSGGSTEDVSNQIDSRSTEKVITASGNAVGFSTNNFYGRGWYFDGQSTTYVEAAASNDFVVGTGDFTIEGWFNPNATQATNGRLWGQQTTAADTDYDCYIGGSFGTSDIMMNGGNTDLGMNFPTAGEWHHIAVCRSGTNLYSFMNGVLKRINSNYTNTLGTNNDTFRVAKIGGNNTGYAFAGGVQDFRFYNGVAKYTSDFIPASINPDILPDTPSGVSGSSKLTKITEGAVAFDGIDYLSISQSNDFNLLDDGTFTIEFFLYVRAFTGADPSYADYFGVFDGGSTGLLIYQIGSNLDVYINGGQRCTTAHPGTNKWHHIAVTRDGTTLRLFVDGILKSTSTASLGSDYSGALHIGGDPSRNDLDGYISNVRVIKGTALYTSNFTPPTEPLTNVTNTKLLCCQKEQLTDNFIRMFLSDTLYTTKADILANATEVGDGASVPGNKYWYIVPTGTEPIGNGTNDVYTNDGSITTPHSSNNFAVFFRNGSSWTKTGGTFNSGEYDLFKYNTGDVANAGRIDPSRDFYVYGADTTNVPGGTIEPMMIGGTLPTRAKYYHITGAVKPGSITVNGDAKPTNFNPFSTDINTVRGQETNYCTLNPLQEKVSSTANELLISNGNLDVDTSSSGNNHSHCGSTFSVSSGKWYFEVTKTSSTVARGDGFGVAQTKLVPNPANDWLDFGVGKNYIYPQDNGIYMTDGATDVHIASATSAANDPGVYMFAYDFDAGKGWVGKDGVWYSWNSLTGGNPANGINPVFDDFEIGEYYTPVVTHYTAGNPYSFNFGQKPFKFPPPDGFQPLNAANVRPVNVIARPDQYVGVATYRGNSEAPSAGGNPIKLSMQPDLVWIKNRFGTSNNHILTDSVRGANNSLFSDTDGAQSSVAHGVDFQRNGFITSGSNDAYNNSSEDYVAWTWKAGGEVGVGRSFMIDDVGYATTSTAGFNPQATEIAPDSASISTKAGFSIVKYTGSGNDGDGVLHGLSQKPDLVIVKNIDRSSTEWRVWQSGWNANDNLLLGSNGSQDLGSPVDGYVGGHTSSNTSITMSNGSTGADDVNRSGDNYIMYSWHDVPGLQKFGTFVGVNDPDGPFIELGFRPAIIWVKRISGSGNNWVVQDSERQKYNPVSEYLLLNSSNQFGSGLDVDFLSNGFKIRNTNGNMNASSTYIYCAWAESPSVNLYGGQSNAR